MEEAKKLNGKRESERKPSDVGREKVTKEKARDADLERETDVVPAVTVSPPDDDTNECKQTGHAQSINSVGKGVVRRLVVIISSANKPNMYVLTCS